MGWRGTYIFDWAVFGLKYLVKLFLYWVIKQLVFCLLLLSTLTHHSLFLEFDYKIKRLTFKEQHYFFINMTGNIHHHQIKANHFKTMNMSLMHRKRVNWTAKTIPNIGSCFPLIPSKFFRRATIKKSEEQANAQSKNIHCKNEKGRMHSTIAIKNDILAYPYIHMSCISMKLHLVRLA